MSSPQRLTPRQAGERAEDLARQRRRGPPLASDTVLSHAGVDALAAPNAPLAPPLHLATTYTRPAGGAYEPGDSIYTRFDNPTRLLFEQEMTRLELHLGDGTNGGAASDAPSNLSCAFASGMMAVASIVLAHGAPLLVLHGHDLYHGVPNALRTVFQRFNVATRRIDMDQVEFELRDLPTETDILLWIESPSNPQTHVVDIAHVCSLVKRASHLRITVVVDSTLAPLQRPLRLGADVALHSATKYLGGHSDVLAGVATVHPSRAADLLPRLRGVQTALGGVAAPLDAWLALRGLRTLSLRYQRQSATALRAAEFLARQPAVVRVHYPGLPSHPQHSVAQRQMDGLFGGVLSLELPTEAQALAFAGALRVVARATSLGGTESLVEHRASVEPPDAVVSPPGLLRLSVGLEEAEDLIADLAQALGIMEEVCGGG